MVVKFLPVPDSEPRPSGERQNLAEVIDFRSRLVLRENNAASDAADTADAANGSGAAAETAVETKNTARKPTLAELRELLQSGVYSAQQGETVAVRETAAAADAVKLLARKALSSGELLAKLQELGHSREVAEEQLAYCESNLYLDDLALARALCEKLRTGKGMSLAQLRIKLRERKIPDGIVSQVLAELDSEEESELLREAARNRAKRLVSLPPEVAERRLLGFLARRGWGGYEAREAAREALQEAIADC